MIKLCFFVPEAYLEEVKRAVFEAGGGRIGNYDWCCWQTLGEGQFRPGKGAKPHTGMHNCLERVPEYKVEMVIDDSLVAEAVRALRQSHPYEEPAFEIYRLIDIND